MMIGVSKWKYSQSVIEERQNDCMGYGDPSDYCRNEAWFIKELSKQIEEKFHIRKNLTFAFMEAYSQSGKTNLNDELQQTHWIEETNKLWNEASSRKQTFDFKTIDDVIEENALCKEEKKRLKRDVGSLTIQVESLIDSFNKEVVTLKASSQQQNTKIEVNDKKLSAMNNEVVSLKASSQQQKTKFEVNDQKLSAMATRGSWCAYRHNSWDGKSGDVNYERIIFHETNMKVNGGRPNPLNLKTGNGSFQ